MSFFTNAHNIVMSAQNMTMTAYSGSQAADAADRGFDILCQNVTPTALYGFSSAAQDGCLHGTRLYIQDHIFKWLGDPESEIAMWIYGPAGIGKTAIAQTVAKLCAERGQLSSAFFFCRFDDGRNSAVRLVPTLAFGMLQQAPHMRNVVCTPIANNPLVFSASLQHQIKTVILPALSQPFASSRDTPPRPMLFIIDGLDECTDSGMQKSIIQFFISLLATSTTPNGYKILIVSRPESHIVSTFSATNVSRYVRRLCLDELDTINDIAIFLRAELEVVRQTHPLGTRLKPPWPSSDSFDELLHKSFESFAYASSAIRYISSHDRNPETSLKNLLGLNPGRAHEAHTELDTLYRHILDSLDEQTRYMVRKILCLFSCLSERKVHIFKSILGEETDVVELALLKMSSVIRFERPYFSYYHTSFSDFLVDEKRSGVLYLYSPQVATAVATALISRLWVPPVTVQDCGLLSSVGGLLSKFDTIEVDMQIHILRAFLASHFPKPFVITPNLLFGEFFGKIDRGSRSEHHPAALTLLFCDAFEHLATWLRSQVGDRTSETILSICFSHDFKPPSHISPHLCNILFDLVRRSDDPWYTIRRLLPEEETWKLCIALVRIYLTMPPDVRSFEDMTQSYVTANSFPFFPRVISMTVILIRILQSEPPRAELCHLLEQIISQVEDFEHFYPRQDTCKSTNDVPAIHPMNDIHRFSLLYSSVLTTQESNHACLPIAKAMDSYIRNARRQLPAGELEDSNFGCVQQQQIPPNPSSNTASSIHGAFSMSRPNNDQQAQGAMGGGFTFRGQQSGGPSTNFNFSSLGPGQGTTAAQEPSVNNPPENVFQMPATLHNQPSGLTIQRRENNDHSDGAEPASKQPHGLAFNDPSHKGDDFTTQLEDQKDAKAKLSRACVRCKNLKVRCDAITETEPCKRCYNGDHECVIPGRKIRYTQPISPLTSPPSLLHSKREHLIAEIHAQKEEIESLLQRLEELEGGVGSSQHRGIGKAKAEDGCLSPTSTGGSIYDSKAGNTSEEISSDNTYSKTGQSNSAVGNKAIEEWIAKARVSLHEFGAFIGIEGKGIRKSHLVREDSEYSDDDEEYTDALEQLEGEQQDEGHINLTMETADSQHVTYDSSAEPEDDDKGPGIANDNFKSTPAPNALGRRLESAQYQIPTIFTRGIIIPQEAEILFEIYFENMNLSVSLLDPVLYTAQRTFYRSPFLFTVICAIASRFYSPRPDLYAKIMQQALHTAGMALISGNKNVEMCQAYILLSLYPVPTWKWEDQRSWLYLGLAIRAATDLNLHMPTTTKPLNENHAREVLNRTRVWMNCLNLDRSTGSQYGKPPIISPRDYIANHSDRWWASSAYNMKHFDIQICAHNAELKVITAFIAKIRSDPDHPTGLNRGVDFEGIATETDDELKALAEKWFAELEQTDMTDPQNSFCTGLLRLAFSYSRLVALSYGFQHAFGKTDGVDENPFLMRCLKAATDVIDAVMNDICRPGQLHYFRHGPESQSVFITFASAFLVKLLQPKFASYLTPETRVEIRTLVQSVIDLLGSPAVAVDDRHGPKLYSRFLAKLLAKPMARIDPLSPGPGSTTSSYAPLPRVKKKAYHMTSPSVSSTRSQRPQPPPPAFNSSTFQIPTAVHSHLSAQSNTSSPPATENALSFDSFAPIGPTDPFATETAATNASAQNPNNMMEEGFFQPALPFDDDIVQSLQSPTSPSGWQDISLPGRSWMAQSQKIFGLDPNNGAVYDQNMDFDNHNTPPN